MQISVDSKRKNRKIISVVITFMVIPAIVLTGAVVFRERAYLFVASASALCACVPFFLSFESGKVSTGKIVILSCLTALSVVGRAIFAAVPAFKPVAAMVIICGVYLDAESGFLCGALSALISNIFFMQGPWTPFQMFIWGAIGYLAGIFSVYLKKSKVMLIVSGVVSGIIFSLFMDIWTTMWSFKEFNLPAYISCVITALPVTTVYAVSNVVFLMLLTNPIGKKIERVRTKYGF